MQEGSPKRDRDPATAPEGTQYLEERPNGRVVKNSPYGAKRGSYGWGDTFNKPRKVVSTKYPNVFIGISSLNGVPPAKGTDRGMEGLMEQYQKKFRVLEH